MAPVQRKGKTIRGRRSKPRHLLALKVIRERHGREDWDPSDRLTHRLLDRLEKADPRLYSEASGEIGTTLWHVPARDEIGVRVAEEIVRGRVSERWAVGRIASIYKPSAVPGMDGVAHIVVEATGRRYRPVMAEIPAIEFQRASAPKLFEFDFTFVA